MVSAIQTIFVSSSTGKPDGLFNDELPVTLLTTIP
jgi:hypothetical protein